MSIVRCLFDENIVSDHGGAILNLKGRPRLANCWFNSNQAGDVGGALYSSGNGNGLTLVNCQLLANAGLNQGGGIWAAGTDLVLTNCTFYANVCYMPFGGGLYCSAGTLLLANSILWGNRDAAGTQQTAQLYQTAPQPGQVNFCCVQGLTASLDGTGNIGTDPRFANAAQPAGDSDLRLACDSPCIDAGANDLVSPDFADLDDDGNTTEPTPVDAAAHPRFLDVASVPDTGRGVPPIVDLGAFEYRRVGDVNCDGAVTFADIDGFVLALAGAEAYYAVYPDCDWLNADCNGDGLVDFADIDAFVSQIGLTCR